MSHYNGIDLGEAIRRRIYQALGLEQCSRCIGNFYQSAENEEFGKARLSLFSDFRPEIYTYGSKCSEELIVPTMSKIIGDTFILNLEENEYVTIDIAEAENVHGITKNMSILNLPTTKMMINSAQQETV